MIKARRLSDVDYVAELDARSPFLTKVREAGAIEGRKEVRGRTGSEGEPSKLSSQETSAVT